MTNRLGWRPDPSKAPDEKPDVAFEDVRLAAKRMPLSFSLRPWIPNVLDQGALGSCTAHAVAQALRISQIRQGSDVDIELASRLWIYYLARATTGETMLDAGTYLRACFDVIRKLGFPPESAWPYDDSTSGKRAPFRTMPSTSAFRLAHDQMRPTTYRRITSTGGERLETIRRALAAGFAVTFGTDVDDAFVEGRHGFVSPVGSMLRHSVGGHAMLVVGYNDDGSFEVCNSWGSAWGRDGFFDASPELIEEASDLWTVERAPPW